MSLHKTNLASRSKVILIHDSRMGIHDTANILSDYSPELQTLNFDSNELDKTLDLKPQIIFVGLNDTEASIHFYAASLKSGKISHQHTSILLCDNKSSKIAFECCIEGLFDDYCVHKPLYEVYNLRFALHRALKLQAIKGTGNFLDAFGSNQEIHKIIKLAAEHRTVSEQEFIHAKQNATEVDKIILDKSATPILLKFQGEVLSPVFDKLETNITNSFDEFIQKVEKEVFSFNKDEVLPTTKTEVQLEEQINKTNIQEGNPQNIKKQFNGHMALIVDDNNLFRNVLKKALEKMGMGVYQVADGEEAILAVRSFIFDIAILDLFMPKMDGMETTKRIRKMANGENLPIIALTGNKNKDDAMKWIKLGLNGYLLKPVTIEKLQLEIVKHL